MWRPSIVWVCTTMVSSLVSCHGINPPTPNLWHWLVRADTQVGIHELQEAVNDNSLVTLQCFVEDLAPTAQSVLTRAFGLCPASCIHQLSPL